MAVVRVSTRGGSWVRDKMMDRRIRQEYARQATPAEAVAVMGFGKHKGVRVVEVEEAYLVWCAETLASCPAYIVRELERRGRMVAKDFAGESHLTANAQSKKTLRSEQKKSRLSEKSAKRRAARAARQSEASAEKLRAMRDGVVITGSAYARLRVEYERAGGDADACPFDCDDYSYSGPEMVCSGGRTIMVPSEFPATRQT
jgi:hypothetical protein